MAGKTHNIVYKKNKKIDNDDQNNIYMNKVDPIALLMLVERQREKMPGLEAHEAATVGDYDSLADCVTSGRVDINMKDPEWQDKTPLHWACARGFVECTRLLLQYGAKGTARMSMGWTPAHCAAEAGKIHILRALHNANVSIRKKDKYGDTPKNVAHTYGNWDCVKFLKIAEKERAENRQNRPPEDQESDSDQSYDEDSQHEKS